MYTVQLFADGNSSICVHIRKTIQYGSLFMYVFRTPYMEMDLMLDNFQFSFYQ